MKWLGLSNSYWTDWLNLDLGEGTIPDDINRRISEIYLPTVHVTIIVFEQKTDIIGFTNYKAAK